MGKSSKVHADNVSIKSFKNEADNVSLKSFKNDSDNVSIKSFKNEADNVSIKSFQNDADNISIKSFKDNSDNVSIKSFTNEPDNVSVKSLRMKDDDNVSIKSYSVEGDYVLSLHQRVVVKSLDAEPIAPTPAPREIRNQVETVAVETEETEQDDDTSSIVDSDPEPLSYEDARATKDFESIVRENVSKNKTDKEKSNVEILEDIAREEGEDRPNVAQLLAWAKGTKKPKTETFVIRKKNREELLRKSVDTGTFEVVIQDRVTKQNGVTTIDTGTKKFQVAKKKSPFEVRKTSEIQPETVVTREWLQKAVNEFENDSFANVVKMDFTLVTKGTYQATIEADVSGSLKQYSWVIKDAPTSDVS